MEYREVKKYNWAGDENLNKAMLRFHRYMAKKYGTKKYTVLMDSFIPKTDDGRGSIYSVLFEFKGAKKQSNLERVGKE